MHFMVTVFFACQAGFGFIDINHHGAGWLKIRPLIISANAGEIMGPQSLKKNLDLRVFWAWDSLLKTGKNKLTG